MKYVLYCHSGSANHGCEALVRTVAEVLQPAEVVVLSDAPEEDKKYGVDLIAKSIKSVSKVKKSDWVKAYWRLKTKQDYHYMDAIPYFSQLDIIKKGDIAISIGGDIYCYDHYPKYMYINQEIRKRARKMILMGCSIEPELLKDQKLCEDLKQYDLITARESITYEAVRKVNPNTILIPDTAFVLERKDLPLPADWCHDNMIGLNLSPLVLQKAENPEVVIEAFKELIRYVLTETDMGVALIPHVVWDNNDDRKPLTELYEYFKDTGRVVMVDDQNCCELKGYIARCRFFIGARTHSTIAAYSSGVPTLVIGYSVKARGIAKDLFGTEEGYVLPVQKINDKLEIVSALKEIIQFEDLIRLKFQEKNISFSEIQNTIKKEIGYE